MPSPPPGNLAGDRSSPSLPGPAQCHGMCMAEAVGIAASSRRPATPPSLQIRLCQSKATWLEHAEAAQASTKADEVGARMRGRGLVNWVGGSGEQGRGCRHAGLPSTTLPGDARRNALAEAWLITGMTPAGSSGRGGWQGLVPGHGVVADTPTSCMCEGGRGVQADPFECRTCHTQALGEIEEELARKDAEARGENDASMYVRCAWNGGFWTCLGDRSSRSACAQGLAGVQAGAPPGAAAPPLQQRGCRAPDMVQEDDGCQAAS